MPINRFFLDAVLKDQVILDDQEFRHLAQVVRVKTGETVELFNGKGDLATATVVSMDKKSAQLLIIETKHHKPSAPLILAQALPRINRLDYLIEKCTELGMTELWLFPGELSERKSLTEHQLERLNHLTIAACKQSGRLWLPTIKWLDAISKWKTPLKAVFGDPTASVSLMDSNPLPEVLCIGPESGFTDNEHTLLAKLGAQPRVWNNAVLRTDTAAISGVAILSALG